MTAQATPSARNAARRVPCPHCSYRAENAGSIPAHVAMAHPELAAAGDAPACVGSNHVPGCDHFGAAPAATPPPAGAAILELPLELVDVGDNVRVNPDELEELAASIAEHGVLQPIKATGPHDDGRFLVTWGQRRTLASRMAGRATVPAIVLPPDADVDAHGAPRAIEQLVENLHRADLNPIDRATAMRAVVDSGISAADLARKLGIAPSTISNDLGLLDAPTEIRQLLGDGRLTPAHAKAMKGLAPKSQLELAKEVLERGYSAHRTEQEVQHRREQAELEAERRKADAAELEARRKAVDAVIAEQVAKGVPLDVEVVVAGSYYSNDSSAWLIGRLKAGGFARARKANGWQETEPRPGGGVCDCRAFRARVTESVRYQGSKRVVTNGLKWETACLEPKHRAAKAAAGEEKRLAKEATARRVQEHVKRTASAWAVPGARAISIDRILAEAVLWDILSYRVPEWAVAHGGTRKNPFAAIHALSDEGLAKELADEIARDFRDKAGYHVDWPALAAELLHEPEASA
ncbi:MAG: ParB/RepB/Spo0J family partition protein [Chloroflexota bacterium]